jgi:hypothetical protein
MATASQLLEFDANGNFVREIGKNLNAWSYAHAVRIDPQDNIWVVDKGSNMILRFTPEGHVDWVFGRKGEASHLQVPPDYQTVSSDCSTEPAWTSKLQRPTIRVGRFRCIRTTSSTNPPM